jgi:hypothetical protein
MNTGVLLQIVAKVAIEWMALLLQVQQVQGSKIGPKADYSELSFLVMYLRFQASAGYYLKIVHDRAHLKLMFHNYPAVRRVG